METVHFEVGAKAAQLIGRENIADVDGALVELIKNAYDADATCVCVCFDMPFPYSPTKLDAQTLKMVLRKEDRDIILPFFEQNREKIWVKRKDLSDEDQEVLAETLGKYNRIIVADNGTGMSYDDVKTKWMYIATKEKEYNVQSPKGRIKTGAKGIGRFAMDKLSLRTEMYTQAENETMVSWKLSWEQFEKTQLLSQVGAEIELRDADYSETVSNILATVFPDQMRTYSWSSGTMLILSPTRENWSERLFEKVKDNLKSINPLGEADPFRVYIRNVYYSQYNFETEETAIQEKDFDYRIRVHFDGNSTLNVNLLRNEVDIQKKSVLIKGYAQSIETNGFWSRPYFQRKDYNREDFAKEVLFTFDLTSRLKDDPNKIRNIGPFDAELYFGKTNSSKEEIIKKVQKQRRHDLYNTFAGIKIYRDRFKIRPYGDRGGNLDWLGLSQRQAASPGGVGDDSHNWKVLPYQLIGQVIITREKNLGLYDMANREGLTANDEFNIFREILLIAIDCFEIDRREFYWEYNAWQEEAIKALGSDANIRMDVASEWEKSAETGGTKKHKSEDLMGERFTEQEYRETVYHLMQEKEHLQGAERVLQMLSSSGLILNTFFHEFKAFESHINARSSQLRARIDYMVDTGNLHPGPVFDPYIIIQQMDKDDGLLSQWLSIAMDKNERKYLEPTDCDLLELISDIQKQWKGLLDQKEISIEIPAETEETYPFKLAKTDLYIILNNFLLNSVYFLEKEIIEKRRIVIRLEKSEKQYHLNLWNNGPTLDPKYSSQPTKIFELGESSKEDDHGAQGTGIGLWIAKAAVERYGGTILVSEMGEGFGLDIYWNR